jgi:hypothetical protein
VVVNCTVLAQKIEPLAPLNSPVRDVTVPRSICKTVFSVSQCSLRTYRRGQRPAGECERERRVHLVPAAGHTEGTPLRWFEVDAAHAVAEERAAWRDHVEREAEQRAGALGRSVAEVAELGERLARSARGSVARDAELAVLIVGGAVAAAARLVEPGGADDPRLERVRALIEKARPKPVRAVTKGRPRSPVRCPTSLPQAPRRRGTKPPASQPQQFCASSPPLPGC